MQRSAGVTAVGVVAIIGGALTCLFALFAAFAAVMIPQLPNKTPTAFPAAVLGVEAAVFLGVGAWAIASAIGLLRLKNWARISILVLGGLLVGFGFCGLFGAVMLTVMPMPTPPGKEVPHSFMAVVGAIMAAWCLIQMAVGIWWLVLLNRKAVKQQFLGEGVTQAVGGRPVSITVIAWFMTVSGVLSIPFYLATRYPAMLFGMLIHGWLAKAFYLLYLLASVAIGIGLLRLKPLSHTLALWFYVFGLVNLAANLLLPGAHARFEALLQEALKPDQAWMATSARSFLWFGFVLGALATAVPLWFLVTRKEAYLAAANQPLHSPQMS
jgi:hypothetical protein